MQPEAQLTEFTTVSDYFPAESRPYSRRYMCVRTIGIHTRLWLLTEDPTSVLQSTQVLLDAMESHYQYF